MKEYVVYFEIYGKKMRTTVRASSATHAQEIVKGKIIFHKTINTEHNEFEDIINKFKDIFSK